MRLARLIDWSVPGAPTASGPSVDRGGEDGDVSDVASDDVASSDCDEPATGAVCGSGRGKAAVEDDDGSGLPWQDNTATTLAAHASRAKLVSKIGQAVLPDLSSSVAAIDELDEDVQDEGDRTHFTHDTHFATASSSGRCHRDSSVRS